MVSQVLPIRIGLSASPVLDGKAGGAGYQLGILSLWMVLWTKFVLRGKGTLTSALSHKDHIIHLNY